MNTTQCHYRQMVCHPPIVVKRKQQVVWSCQSRHPLVNPEICNINKIYMFRTTTMIGWKKLSLKIMSSLRIFREHSVTNCWCMWLNSVISGRYRISCLWGVECQLLMLALFWQKHLSQ